MEATMSNFINILIKKIKGARTFLIKHSDEVWYFIRKGRVRKACNLIWSQLWVRDIDGGKFDFIFKMIPFMAPYPKEIEIEITTKCYMRCVMCEHTYWKDEKYRHQDMTFEQFKLIIDQFPKLRYINVTGEGTGFLNKDFFKMLGYLNQKNVNTMFVESFDLFKEDYIEKVIDLDVERIEVSIDAASKETYEKIRVGAKWERVIKNLRALKEIKKKRKTPLPYIFFRLIAMKDNITEIPKLLELIHELDVNLGKLTDVQVVGLLSFPDIDHLNVANIPQEIISVADDLAKKYNINLIWSHTTNNCATMDSCAKWLQPYIMIDGSALLDCALLMSNNRIKLKNDALGNLFQENFKDIWDKQRYRKARAGVNRKNGQVPYLCQNCRGYDTSFREKTFGIQKDIKDTN